MAFPSQAKKQTMIAKAYTMEKTMSIDKDIPRWFISIEFLCMLPRHLLLKPWFYKPYCLVQVVHTN